MYVVTTTPVFIKGKFHGVSPTTLSMEKNLTGCSVAALRAHGGPLTLSVLDQIQTLFKDPLESATNAGLEPIFNVGISPMLVGQYSEVPGWHCDGVPYHRIYGQPDFTLIHPRAFNISLTLSSELMGVATQEYVADILKPRIWDERHVFKDLHREVVRMQPRIVFPTDGEFVSYSPKTMIRARACTRRGYQYHLRMSLYEKPSFQNKVGGVRVVYQLSEENGW